MTGKVGELPLITPPPICVAEGCLKDAAPGNVFCWNCIRSKSRSVKDYQAKAEKHAASRALKMQARMRPRLYAVALGSAVKFGITVDIGHRLSGLQTGVPDQLVLLGHVGCDRELEREVHELCRKHHVRGEWFRRDGVVLTVEQHIAENDVLSIYRLVGRIPYWLKD